MAATLLFASSGCDTEHAALPVKVTRDTDEVEVAPARWVSVERNDVEVEVELGEQGRIAIPIPGDSGTTHLAIPWQGRTVVWQGRSVPFCLREWKDELFVIGLDRTDLDKCRFRYYRQDGDGFREIPPEEFPKRVATQNMWFGNVDDYSIGIGGQRIYELKLARELDLDNVYFRKTLTAAVWQHLTNGVDYYQNKTPDKEMLRAFKKEHAPIALPTIVQTPEGWPKVLANPEEIAPADPS